MRDQLQLLASYLKTRHGLRFKSRHDLEHYQQKKIQRFIANTLKNSPFYKPHIGKPLTQFPIINKQITMENFDTINTRSIKRNEAMALAERAEKTRDFTPDLDGISVGLSTGTSGRRGLFLASRTERMAWAGIILGRMLPGTLLNTHRIAFFLRANNNLYESVTGSRTIKFRFFDLTTPLPTHLPDLKTFKPTILIAPAQVLRELAHLESHRRQSQREPETNITPAKIISVAEVLFDDDRAKIENVFKTRVDQIYQCTEGFLAYTCAHGRLHLNESYLHIEPEWLDDDKTRFFPIITDFSRHTQPIVRYRLDDILTLDDRPCPCASQERVIARIEGRADDILVFISNQNGAPQHLMPDFISRALAGAGTSIQDFRVEQPALDQLNIFLKTDDIEAARRKAETALIDMAKSRDLKIPNMVFAPLSTADFNKKRRRISRAPKIAL